MFNFTFSYKVCRVSEHQPFASSGNIHIYTNKFRYCVIKNSGDLSKMYFQLSNGFI